MPLVPKSWQDGSAGGTPITAASLVDLENRMGGYTDQRRKDDPTIFDRIRNFNDWTNPRPATTGGWALAALNGSSNASSIVSDTTFNEPGLASGGSAYDATSTLASGMNYTQANLSVKVGDPITTNGVIGNLKSVAGTRQIVFGRARVKLLQGVAGPNNLINLQILTNDGTTTQARVVRQYDRVSPGDILDLEGFDLAIQGATRCALQIGVTTMTTLASATVFQMRVGLAQICTDPGNECGRYISGSCPEGYWVGTADVSQSQGNLPRARSSNSSFEVGFNDYASAYQTADNPMWADEAAELIREIGGTSERVPMNFTSLTSDPAIFWSAGQQLPDYTTSTNFKYKNLLDAYRKAGVRVTWLLGGIPSWMAIPSLGGAGSGPTWAMDTQYQTRYAQAINALISLYPDVITAVEFNNEPNIGAVWGTYPSSTPSPATFMSYMTPLYNAIKAANPQVTFISGAPADYWTTNATNLSAGDWLAGCYANGLKTSCDAIGIHLYPSEPTSGDLQTASAPGTYSTTNTWGPGWDMSVRAFRSIQNTNNDLSKKLWLTETGANANSAGVANGTNQPAPWTERTQAQFYMLTLALTKNDSRFVGWTNNGLFTNFSETSSNWAPVEQKTMRKRQSFWGIKKGKLLDGEYTPFILQNSWQAFNGQVPAYRIMPDGMVHIRGAVTGGSTAGAVILYVPAGIRPMNGSIFGGVGYNGTATVATAYEILGGSFFAVLGATTTQMYFDIMYPPVAAT